MGDLSTTVAGWLLGALFLAGGFLWWGAILICIIQSIRAKTRAHLIWGAPAAWALIAMTLVIMGLTASMTSGFDAMLMVPVAILSPPLALGLVLLDAAANFSVFVLPPVVAAVLIASWVWWRRKQSLKSPAWRVPATMAALVLSSVVCLEINARAIHAYQVYRLHADVLSFKGPIASAWQNTIHNGGAMIEGRYQKWHYTKGGYGYLME